MAGLEDLYREIILDHYRSPRNRGELPVPPAHKVEGFNPLCGDEVVLYIDVDADTGTVTDVKIAGQGCSISQASTSVMSELVVGKPIDDAMALQDKFLALMQSRGHAELSETDQDELDDAVAFEGVSKYPARIKCALLGWMAMKSAVAEAGWGYSAENSAEETA